MILLTSTRCVYSPCFIQQASDLVLYCGGWGPDQISASVPQDTIYRCVIGSPPASDISALQPILRPQDYGLGLFNDPTIALMSGGYYVMYLTCVADPTPGAGDTITNNAVYFSTSWADDGINWSGPQLLVSTAWCPGATIGPDDDTRLYCNSTANGALLCYDLGSSGVTVGTSMSIVAPKPYCNVEVTWRPTLNLYQILAQSIAYDGDNNPTGSTVDYLTSADGIIWTLVRENILPDQTYAITPATHPDTDGWVYFGAGPGFAESAWNVAWEQWI